MNEDRGSHTERDAALWEAARGRDDHVDDRPTLAELQRDEAAEWTTRHACHGDYGCALPRVHQGPCIPRDPS